MPCRVPEDREHDGEANQERHRSEEQTDRDDQSPQGHGSGIFNRGAYGCSNCRRGADVAIDEHRERDDARHQDDQREDKADRVADDDELRASRGRRQLIPELLRR